MTAPEIDLNVLASEVHRVVGLDSEPSMRFLARGEHSINYLIEGTSEPLVIRCVTGSQIGLPLDEQVRYESRALGLLETSARTPRFIAAQPDTRELPFPFLVESYFAGGPLDYANDLEGAAHCVADIHQVAVPPDHGLQVHRDPGPSIVTESRGWAEPYLSWSDGPRASQEALQRAFASVEADLEQAATIFAEPDLVFVNYDLNTHNFIVHPADRFVALVDWEKARVAPAVQDLAHFLLPTTTLWRVATATQLAQEQEMRFLDTYLATRPHLDRERFMAQLEQMKRLIALRAVSWCSWAVVTIDAGTRAIANVETIERSRMYLDPAFLDRLFAAKTV